MMQELMCSQCWMQSFPLIKHKIPLGFGLELPGFAAFVAPRSGSSKGISCEMAPIDSSYRGECHAIVINNSSEPYVVNKNDRIGQLIVIPVIIPTLLKLLQEEIMDSEVLEFNRRRINGTIRFKAVNKSEMIEVYTDGGCRSSATKKGEKNRALRFICMGRILNLWR